MMMAVAVSVAIVIVAARTVAAVPAAMRPAIVAEAARQAEHDRGQQHERTRARKLDTHGTSPHRAERSPDRRLRNDDYAPPAADVPEAAARVVRRSCPSLCRTSRPKRAKPLEKSARYA